MAEQNFTTEEISNEIWRDIKRFGSWKNIINHIQI